MAKIIFKDAPADRSDQISLTGGLDAIRTDGASTERRSICHAVLQVEASYTETGRPDRKAGQYDQDVRSWIDKVMEAANLPDAERVTVRQTEIYKGVTMATALNRASTNTGVSAPVLQAIEIGLTKDQTRSYNPVSLVYETEAFKELVAQDRADQARDKSFKVDEYYVEQAASGAKRISGDIVYTVEPTDDGRAFITLISGPG